MLPDSVSAQGPVSAKALMLPIWPFSMAHRDMASAMPGTPPGRRESKDIHDKAHFRAQNPLHSCAPAANRRPCPGQWAALAQLVEHIIRNDGVTCSSHVSGTRASSQNISIHWLCWIFGRFHPPGVPAFGHDFVPLFTSGGAFPEETGAWQKALSPNVLSSLI